LYSTKATLDSKIKLNMLSTIFHELKFKNIDKENLENIINEAYNKYIDEVSNGKLPNAHATLFRTPSRFLFGHSVGVNSDS
jgi:hypothetical protein